MKKNIIIPKPSPTQVFDALKIIVDAHKENQQVMEIEQTKRKAIEAQKEVELKKLKKQRKVLEQYLEETFSERKMVITKMFDVLDKGIDSNNLELIQQSLASIVAIAKESPLKGIQNLIQDFDNPNVDEIVI